MWPISGRVLVCSAWPVHVCVWSWLKSLKTSELMHAVALDCCACSPLPGSGIAIRSSAGVCLGFRFLALRAFLLSMLRVENIFLHTRFKIIFFIMDLAIDSTYRV